MKTVIRSIIVLASCLALPVLAADKPAFPQVTSVQGKLPANLSGAWFLYAQAEFPGGKTRALTPEIVTASPGRDGDVAMRLLDVQLPPSIYEPFQAANRQPKAWEPSPDDLALLRKQWSKLPPATNKDWRKSEMVFDRVEFTLVTPDKYAEGLGDIGGGIADALPGSAFTLRVVEKYRPQQTPAEEKVAQVMERKSVYVVRSVTDGVLEGKQFTGYLAAGPGLPLPITLTGPFKLYRLAKGAPAKPSTPAGPTRKGGRR